MIRFRAFSALLSYNTNEATSTFCPHVLCSFNHWLSNEQTFSQNCKRFRKLLASVLRRDESEAVSQSCHIVNYQHFRMRYILKTQNNCIFCHRGCFFNSKKKLNNFHFHFPELFELIKEHNSSFPDKQDLQGCASAILRIQDVYNISAERIASGKLSHKTLSPEMDAAHCLELGFMRHHWEQYEEAYGWLIEAWKRMNPQDNSSGITTKDVLQYLIWAEYKVI